MVISLLFEFVGQNGRKVVPIYLHLTGSRVNILTIQMDWLRDLGAQIRNAREVAELTQAQLAKSLSVSRAQLSNYENGKSPPNVNVVTEIAKALETEFVVGGYRISRDDLIQRPAEAAGEQLCFEFGREHRFSVASVKIMPSKDSILIETVVSRRS